MRSIELVASISSHLLSHVPSLFTILGENRHRGAVVGNTGAGGAEASHFHLRKTVPRLSRFGLPRNYCGDTYKPPIHSQGGFLLPVSASRN